MKLSAGYLTTDSGIRLFFQKAGEGERALVIPNGIYLFEDFQDLAQGRTLLAYDVRNRGRSEAVEDPAKLAAGVLNDVDDLEAVRRDFGLEQMDLLGHSYIASMVAKYAVTHPERVRRLVQMGPMTPFAGKQYTGDLMYADAVTGSVFSRLGQMAQETGGSAEERCNRFSAVLAELCVVDPADAHKVQWGRCELPNESGFMKYWLGFLALSLAKLEFGAEEVGRMTAPVLVVHGRKDRNAPYGGGVDWAGLWPDGRLLTVEQGAHAPWVEEREMVLRGIEEFFG